MQRKKYFTKHKNFATMVRFNKNNLRRKGAYDMTAKKDKIKEPRPALTVSKALGGVGGIFMAFVIASISYSSYLVYAGTAGLAPKLMLIPQVVFATLVVLYKFAK